MRFLVTGASGFVGEILCAELVKRGYVVRGVSRTDKPSVENVEMIRIDTISDSTNWIDALKDVDVVIHLAARVHVLHEDAADSLEAYRRVNVAGTEHLARLAAANGVKRLVFVSTIKVNGEETIDGYRFTEQDIPLPQDPYAVSKYEAELSLHRVAGETGMEIVILRAPLVYGAGVKGNFAIMLRVLRSGLPLPLASVENRRSMLYVGNLADALCKCAVHPAAAGKTYLISDGEDVSTPELLSQLGVAMETAAWLFPCSPKLLKLVGGLFGKSDQLARLQNSLQVDNSKIRFELGWNPPFTLLQGLKITAEWYRRSLASQE